VNGVNAVGCLPAGEVLSAGQTAIGTVQAGVTSSTPSVTSTTMSTTASTTGESDSSLTESTQEFIHKFDDHSRVCFDVSNTIANRE
jgi:hypothetical protein